MVDNNIQALSPEKATQWIREIAKWGDVQLTFHIKKRMKQRKYDPQDLECILDKGKVKKPAEWDGEYGEWTYCMEGVAIEGDKAVVVLSIVEDKKIKCITIKPG